MSIEWDVVPFPLVTRSTPSMLLDVKTLGFDDSINDHIRWYVVKLELRKNEAVEPPLRTPYLILVCLAKSSALSMGESIRSTVRKAAKLAVYDEIIINVKNHHIPATIRVETALK